MKKKRLFTLMVLASLLIFSNFATGQDKDKGGRPLSTTLTGAAEVPGPGDTDGGGTAQITLNQGQNQVCFELTVSNIATATAAHIHEAPTGQAGPPVVTLTPPPAEGSSKNCVSADAELIKRIRQNPANFYVNVHNAEFPNGAVRGQLSK
ncbi:MAG TPA: CHRD domain-containing protein [Blastocatellia bacterium]|nr:CHRD domain-containing protein [Blastocatellia bacterium]